MINIFLVSLQIIDKNMEIKENCKKYHPRKIADKIWQFYVHDYENVEIYVFDSIPFKEDLMKINISEESINFYMKNKNYGDGEGRCMDEIKEPNRYIIIVACYNFITNTDYVNFSTAIHELNHCSHRILASKGERTFSHYEESHCTMQDWLVEAYLCIHLNNCDFSRLYEGRDLLWFKTLTNN